jgi:hypothetical protein
MAFKFIRTQTSPTFEKWEAEHNRGFGSKTRGSITLNKMTGYPKIRYGISADLYDTKVIGLQGEEALTKVRRRKTIIVGTYKTAKKKISQYKKQYGGLI